jgi:hypothetical protein
VLAHNPPRHVSLPAESVVQPGKRKYVRMDEFRPEMAQLLVRALKKAAGEEATAAALKACAEEFTELHGGDDCKLDAGYLARDTLERLQKSGVVSDLPRSGRPRVALDEDVEQFLHIFLAGNLKNTQDTRWWGFTSLRHALIEKQELRDLLEKMGIKPEALWLRMQAKHLELYGKSMNKISIKRRPVMSAKTKKTRLAAARLWKEWGFDKLCKVVWIDEKQEYLHSGGAYHCYAPPDVKSMQRACEVKLGKSQKVKYEAAVSAFGGAIFFTFITGTTGREQFFLVRTFIPLRRHLDPSRWAARPPCLLQELFLHTRVLVADAQDTKLLPGCRSAGAHVRARLAMVVFLVRAVLLAVDKDEQASFEVCNIGCDAPPKDDDVHTDSA